MELKVLITWFRGFIGKHLTTILSENNIQWVWFEGNLLDTENIENFFQKNKIETVVHLVGAFEEPFDHQMKLNFDTTKNLIQVWIKYWLKKIIYTSTGAVYGEPSWEKSLEDDILLPNTFYGLSKKLTEDLIQYYTRQNLLESIILRFPNVYGEWNNKWVIYNFKNSIKNLNKVILYWDWTQKRNFLFVKDASESIVNALTYKNSWVFNIATTHAYSLNDVLEALSKKYVFDIEKRDSNNNLKNLILDVHKAQEVLEFSPQYNELII